MVYKRDSANIYSTSRFDGTLLYQLHLAGRILMRESGLYLNRILSHHRLGGIPDFGVSAAEKDLFVPKNQTPESSIHFIRGMLIIAYSLDEESTTKVGHRILRDIANYSYPILSIQADRSFRVFVIYIWQLMKLGFWRAPLFYIYAVGLILLGRKNCDRLIGCLKKLLGRSPLIGVIYSGKSTQIKDR
jgi:hypothetical protein